MHKVCKWQDQIFCFKKSHLNKSDNNFETILSINFTFRILHRYFPLHSSINDNKIDKADYYRTHKGRK